MAATGPRLVTAKALGPGLAPVATTNFFRERRGGCGGRRTRRTPHPMFQVPPAILKTGLSSVSGQLGGGNQHRGGCQCGRRRPGGSTRRVVVEVALPDPPAVVVEVAPVDPAGGGGRSGCAGRSAGCGGRGGAARSGVCGGRAAPPIRSAQEACRYPRRSSTGARRGVRHPVLPSRLHPDHRGHDHRHHQLPGLPGSTPPEVE